MADEAEPRARIIEIGGRSEALGGEVLLELARPFTVLVGRNAAGKSALLRLIDEFALQARASSSTPYQMLAAEFHCAAEIGGRMYRYTASRVLTILPENQTESGLLWKETCFDLSSNAELWSTKAGVVTGLGTQLFVPPSAGLLALDPDHLPSKFAPIVAAFGRLFRHVAFVPAGLPAAVGRSPIMFSREPNTGSFEMRAGSGSSRFDRVARQLVRWYQAKDGSFERVELVLRRLGICETLDFVPLEVKPIPAFGYLEIDDHEIHTASDGTLRVLEVVVALEMAAAGALVMIEEPETGIHPGLCDRIMAEIESAAEGLQIIISTHSPRIIDHVQYHQLRHIRRNGSTRIESLTSEQVELVKTFLSDQGTLGEFVFSESFEDE